MTSTKVERYRELIKLWVVPGFQDTPESDAVLNELDSLWFSMTGEELDEVDPAGATVRKSKERE